MKTLVPALILSTLNVKFDFLPSSYLLLGLFFMVGLDFITGVAKSVVKDVPRTSKAYRETISKFVQYTGAILLSILLSYFVKRVPELSQIEVFSKYINNTILVFIFAIEVVSVLENLHEIDNKSLFSRFLIKPLLKLLTFQLKKFSQNDETTKDS